jgi:hypothetical protein
MDLGSTVITTWVALQAAGSKVKLPDSLLNRIT